MRLEEPSVEFVALECVDTGLTSPGDDGRWPECRLLPLETVAGEDTFWLEALLGALAVDCPMAPRFLPMPTSAAPMPPTDPCGTNFGFLSAESSPGPPLV